MVHATKGVVLRTVKYGETSVIVAIYTELFGIQSYIVNGVRIASRKSPGKAGFFQPSALLDIEVYHNELKNLQRLRDYKWGYIYRHILSDVFKNAVALYMVELLQKTIRQPEAHADLFHFIEDAFIHLDDSPPAVVGNYPLYFALHLASFFGFRFSDDYSPETPYLDLQEGEFVAEHPIHPHFLGGQYSYITSQLLKAMQPHELAEIKLNQDIRNTLLYAYQTFYALHFPEFGVMKSLPVLQEVLG